ncbi:MAG: 4Fe-4S dicluster domain-containing protein [Chloroflexota bacterium]
MAEKAILFDPTKCTACRGCQVACKQWNELEAVPTVNLGSYENPPDLSPNTYIKMRFKELEYDKSLEWLFTRRSCMHCTNAACVEVCPTGALSHHPLGFIDYNEDLCSGCGYCSQFCPFQVPRMSGSSITGIRKASKCLFCADRVTNNLIPACVKTCPPHALQFGDQDQMLLLGRQRVKELKAKYPDAYLYGEDELGGLHVMYVLPHKPTVHGLPADPRLPASTTVWQGILQPAGYVLAGLTVLGLGLNYLVARANVKSHGKG